MKTIELIVAPDGSSKVETKGFAGRECQQASRFLERTLGSIRNKKLTADFYRSRVKDRLQARQQ